MLVSKFPFLDVHFFNFKAKGAKIWMKLIDYGCVMARVNLGQNEKTGRRRVGYLANLHMMAYQVNYVHTRKKVSIIFICFKTNREKKTWLEKQCLRQG